MNLVSYTTWQCKGWNWGVKFGLKSLMIFHPQIEIIGVRVTLIDGYHIGLTPKTINPILKLLPKSKPFGKTVAGLLVTPASLMILILIMSTGCVLQIFASMANYYSI